MRVEAYDLHQEFIEHAGLTWEDLGYRVAVTENPSYTFPTAEFAQLEESCCFTRNEDIGRFLNA